jgi:hypothetical protein
MSAKKASLHALLRRASRMAENAVRTVAVVAAFRPSAPTRRKTTERPLRTVRTQIPRANLIWEKHGLRAGVRGYECGCGD